MTTKRQLNLPSVREALTVAEAVALLLAEGVPMDHYGGAVQCAYCGVTVETLLTGAGHRDVCVWTALRDAVRRLEAAG